MQHLESLFLNQKEIGVQISKQTTEVREVQDLLIESVS